MEPKSGLLTFHVTWSLPGPVAVKVTADAAGIGGVDRHVRGGRLDDDTAALTRAAIENQDRRAGIDDDRTSAGALSTRLPPWPVFRAWAPSSSDDEQLHPVTRSASPSTPRCDVHRANATRSIPTTYRTSPSLGAPLSRRRLDVRAASPTASPSHSSNEKALAQLNHFGSSRYVLQSTASASHAGGDAALCAGYATTLVECRPLFAVALEEPLAARRRGGRRRLRSRRLQRRALAAATGRRLAPGVERITAAPTRAPVGERTLRPMRRRRGRAVTPV